MTRVMLLAVFLLAVAAAGVGFGSVGLIPMSPTDIRNAQVAHQVVVQAGIPASVTPGPGGGR